MIFPAYFQDFHKHKFMVHHSVESYCRLMAFLLALKLNYKQLKPQYAIMFQNNCLQYSVSTYYYCLQSLGILEKLTGNRITGLLYCSKSSFYLSSANDKGEHCTDQLTILPVIDGNFSIVRTNEELLYVRFVAN